MGRVSERLAGLKLTWPSLSKAKLLAGGFPEAFRESTAANGLPIVPEYFGQVATRSAIPSFLSGTAKQINAQRFHIARAAITSLQVAFPNWFANNPLHEAGTGGTATFKAAIQYPIGSAWQPFRWAGAATSQVVADLATSPLTDALRLATPIPAGAQFLIRVFADFAGFAPIIAWDNGTSANGGDLFESAANGLSDKTTNGGAIAASPNSYGACAIVANTTVPSFALIGDSIMRGLMDASDGNGDMGIWARSIGTHFAYINMGVSGESLNGFLTNCTRRLGLAQYCSHVASNHGVNDLFAGRSSTQILGDIGAFAAVFPSKKVYWSTITPSNTSTDGYVTLANQTVGDPGGGGRRVVLNDKLRAGVASGVHKVFDFATVLESAPNSGKWAIGNGGQALVSDGLHPLSLANVMVRNSGLIHPAAFR